MTRAKAPLSWQRMFGGDPTPRPLRQVRHALRVDPKDHFLSQGRGSNPGLNAFKKPLRSLSDKQEGLSLKSGLWQRFQEKKGVHRWT
jgi:hypothetical protein